MCRCFVCGWTGGGSSSRRIGSCGSRRFGRWRAPTVPTQEFPTAQRHPCSSTAANAARIVLVMRRSWVRLPQAAPRRKCIPWPPFSHNLAGQCRVEWTCFAAQFSLTDTWKPIGSTLETRERPCRWARQSCYGDSVGLSSLWCWSSPATLWRHSASYSDRWPWSRSSEACGSPCWRVGGHWVAVRRFAPRTDHATRATYPVKPRISAVAVSTLGWLLRDLRRFRGQR